MARLSRPKLRQIVDDYQHAFPGWTRVGAETLVRTDGPVLQGLGWETLSSGEYRPMNYIQVLAAPEQRRRGRVDFFGEAPKGRPRCLSLRSHRELLPKMLDRMKEEFRPSITSPLSATDVLELCERVAVPTYTQAYALAALNAYFGRYDRAREWSMRYNELVNAIGQPWQEWNHLQRSFLDSLVSWIDNGTVREQLESVVNEERRRWGLEATC